MLSSASRTNPKGKRRYDNVSEKACNHFYRGSTGEDFDRHSGKEATILQDLLSEGAVRMETGGSRRAGSSTAGPTERLRARGCDREVGTEGEPLEGAICEPAWRHTLVECGERVDPGGGAISGESIDQSTLVEQ